MSHEGGRLLFAALGGAVAWTAQLWLLWLLYDLGCRIDRGGPAIGGLGPVAVWLLISVLAGALAAAATWVAYRLMRGPGEERRGRPAAGVRRFIASAAFALNLLLLGTIVLGATAPLFVPPCA